MLSEDEMISVSKENDTEKLQEENIEETVEIIEESVEQTTDYPTYQFEKSWTAICKTVEKEPHLPRNKQQSFLKGCKWSPDGTCLMTCCADNILRLFDLPSDLYASHKKPFQGCSTTKMSPSLRIREGELIYDYCWHPHMSSWQPETCLLATAAKGSPTHFWDAYKGELMATYRAYNSVDEVEPAVSLCISPDGEKLYCGFDKCIRVFDVQVPGRKCQTRPTKSKEEISASQNGLISCIAVNPTLPTVYAAASYMKTIGLYSEPDGTALCLLEGHRGGVTHIKFSPDGLHLYSGGRKDSEILCWDLRNPGHVLFTMNRTVETNQRIYFDLDPTGKYLITGDTSGFIRVWDTIQGLEMASNLSEESGQASALNLLPEVTSFQAHSDCTNGVSCHPWLPLVATSSGQRHIITQSDSSDSDDDGFSSDREEKDRKRKSENIPESTVKLWWTGEMADASVYIDIQLDDSQEKNSQR